MNMMITNADLLYSAKRQRSRSAEDSEFRLYDSVGPAAHMDVRTRPGTRLQRNKRNKRGGMASGCGEMASTPYNRTRELTRKHSATPKNKRLVEATVTCNLWDVCGKIFTSSQSRRT